MQQTEPRPEWYFLFLFELLRVFKEPWQLIFATIIIPTILMVLLIMWPFIDRGRDRRLSRRPWGVAIGLATPGHADRADDRGRRGAGRSAGSNDHREHGVRLAAGGGGDRRRGLYDAAITSAAAAARIGPNLSNGASEPRPGRDQGPDRERRRRDAGVRRARSPTAQIEEIIEFIVGLGTGTPPAQ